MSSFSTFTFTENVTIIIFGSGSTGLLPRLQSAYRNNHSTETAVLKVLSDILLVIDAGDLSALALLSAAFDTVRVYSSIPSSGGNSKYPGVKLC